MVVVVGYFKFEPRCQYKPTSTSSWKSPQAKNSGILKALQNGDQNGSARYGTEMIKDTLIYLKGHKGSSIIMKVFMYEKSL